MWKILKRNLTRVYEYGIYFSQELTDETILSKYKEQIKEKKKMKSVVLREEFMTLKQNLTLG